MDEPELVALTPWQAAMWARGYRRWVVDQLLPDGSTLGHYVHPPKRRSLTSSEYCRALHANALVHCSITKDFLELVDRLEAAADVEAELADLEAIRQVHDSVCAE